MKRVHAAGALGALALGFWMSPLWGSPLAPTLGRRAQSKPDEVKARAQLAEEHFQYGQAFLAKARHDAAIDAFLYALALDPDHVQAHFYLGLTYIQKGLTGLQQADHHLSRAIDIAGDIAGEIANDAKNPRAHHYRGLVRMRLGAYRDAVKDFRLMLDADPDYYPSLYSLGATLMRAERHDEAIDVLRRAIAADPEKLEPRWNLGLAEERAGAKPAKRSEETRLVLSDEGVGEAPFAFEDVAVSQGIRRYSRARGSGWADFDVDGDLDLITVGIRDPHGLYRNNGDGSFTDITTDSGLLDPRGGWSALWLDYDRDSDADLYVTRDGWDGKLPNSLYRNDDGLFVDVAATAGVASDLDAFTAAVADVNLDGHLDLYVANGVATEGGSPNQLFVNRGDGTFVESAARFGVDNHGRSIGSAFGDFNNDGWPDLLVVNFFGNPALYRNVEGKRFEAVGQSAGIHLPKEGFVGFFFDYNNDGWLDIFMVGFAGKMELALESAVNGRAVHADSRLTLYANNGDGTFTDQTVLAGLDRNLGAMAASFGDIDNDGYLDIYLGCGAPAIERFEPNKLYRNLGNGRFEDISRSARVDNLGKGHGVSFADYDQDGDLDFYVPTGGAFLGDRQLGSLYRNPGTDNHWLQLKLEASSGHPDAVGAQVRIFLEDQILLQEVAIGGGFGSTNSLELEFGLGQAETIDRIEIRWPGGARKVLGSVPLDKRIRIHESESGYTVLGSPNQ